MATFFKTIQKTIKHWYLPAVIGSLLIILGIYIFFVPLETYAILVTFFSISFIITGIAESYFSIVNRNAIEGWGWYLSSGVLTLLIGIILIMRPSISALALPFFVGFSLLFRSFQGLGFAIELKNYGFLKWGNLAIASVLGIICSILLIVHPAFTGFSLVVITALSFIFTGISAVVLSFQLKKLKQLPGKVSKDLKDRIESLKEEYYSYLKERKDHND